MNVRYPNARRETRRPARTRRLIAAAALSGVALLASVQMGCQNQHVQQANADFNRNWQGFRNEMQYRPPAPEPADPNGPLVVDKAMERRDWPPSYAVMTNSGVVAFSTRFPYTRKVAGEFAGTTEGGEKPIPVGPYTLGFMDNLEFLLQSVLLPFTYIVTPPFTKFDYYAIRMEPSYTAMPRMYPNTKGPGSANGSANETNNGTITPNAPVDNGNGGNTSPNNTPGTSGGPVGPGATNVPGGTTGRPSGTPGATETPGTGTNSGNTGTPAGPVGVPGTPGGSPAGGSGGKNTGNGTGTGGGAGGAGGGGG